MQEITVKIPQGWFQKFFSLLFVTIIVALVWPYYQLYLARIESESVVIRAQAEAKAAGVAQCQEK